MKIYSNYHARDILGWYDLTDKEKKELDYRDTAEEQESFEGFRYKGQVYDIGEFEWIDIRDEDLRGWLGIFVQGFGFGLVMRFNEDYDGVVVGTFVS